MPPPGHGHSRRQAQIILHLATRGEACGHGEVCGEVAFPLLYDAPHNMLWRQEQDGQELFVHRKGACPARDALVMQATPFRYHGEPVLVPGSMGASSFVLVSLCVVTAAPLDEQGCP